MIRGLDVSQVQGAIADVHWQAVAADKRFVVLRSGVGNDASDTRFAEYVAGARAAGLVVGAYHSGYPLPPDAAHPGRDPEDQAQRHFEACGGLGSSPGDLPPALDLEWPMPTDWAKWGCSGQQITDWAARYLAKAQALYGRTPLVYTYPDFAAHAKLAGLDGYRLWLASYRRAPLAPSPWGSYVMQQVNDGGYRLPSGAPADEDEVADDATFAELLA
jgi:lysozyme